MKSISSDLDPISEPNNAKTTAAEAATSNAEEVSPTLEIPKSWHRMRTAHSKSVSGSIGHVRGFSVEIQQTVSLPYFDFPTA
jgi:hypothetical protein